MENVKQIVAEEVKSFLNEKVYKVYHGTNQKFSRFNPKLTAQGIIWFTDSIDSIKNGEHGGAGNQIIMTRYITINNPAGWDEYQKYGLGQLKDRGYDGVILPDEGVRNYFVFDTKNISAKPPQGMNEYDSSVNMDNSSPIPLPDFGDRIQSISEETGTKVLMPNVSDSDANKLIEWWNANTDYYHFKVKRVSNNLYDVVRQSTK
jgi:hypothetical protein